MTPTRGLKSTEFWLVVLIVLSATALLAFDAIEADQWEETTKWAGAGYGLSRGLAKLGND